MSKYMTSNKFLDLVLEAHSGQKRRDGSDYSSHPVRVANRVRRLFPEDTGVMFQAALGHDLFEDTEITRSTLYARGVNPEVIRLIGILTFEDGMNYEDYIARIAADPMAREIKQLDMEDNLNDDPTPKQIRKYSRGLGYIEGFKAGMAHAAGVCF